MVQEVVQFAGVFGGQSGCSLAVGEAGQPGAAGQLLSVQEVLGDARREV